MLTTEEERRRTNIYTAFVTVKTKMLTEFLRWMFKGDQFQ